MFEFVRKSSTTLFFCIMYKFHDSYFVIFVNSVILGFLYLVYFYVTHLYIFQTFYIYLYFMISIYSFFSFHGATVGPYAFWTHVRILETCSHSRTSFKKQVMFFAPPRYPQQGTMEPCSRSRRIFAFQNHARVSQTCSQSVSLFKMYKHVYPCTCKRPTRIRDLHV